MNVLGITAYTGVEWSQNYHGIVGVNHATPNGGSNYISNLFTAGKTDKNMFSLYLQPMSSKDTSYFEVGSYDTKKISNVTWIKTTSNEEWEVKNNAIYFGSKNSRSRKITTNIDAVILSATSMSYIPEKYWDDFLDGVGQRKSWKFDEDLGYFWIKCSSVDDFNGIWLELDEEFVYIAPANFIQRSDGECWLFVDYSDDNYMWLG